MATVPYTNQVAPNAVEAPQFRAPNPSAFQTGAAQAVQFGNAVQSAADALGGAMLKIQEQRNVEVVTKAEAQLVTLESDFRRQASEQRGDKAYGLTEQAGKWWDEIPAKVGADLENDAQRRAFEMIVAKRRPSSVDAIASHEARENRQALRDSTEAGINTSIAAAAASPTDAALVDTNKTRMLSQFNGWAIAEGLGTVGKDGQFQPSSERSATIYENKKRAITTKFHGEIVQALVDRDPEMAKEWFYKHKDEIDGTAQAQLKRTIDAGEIRGMAQEAANAVMAMETPESEAYSWIRENYSGKEQDEVLREVKLRFSEVEAMRNDLRAENLRAAEGHIANGRRIPASLYAQLDGDQQLHVRRLEESAARGEPLKTDIRKWLEFTNMPRDQLANMTPSQLYNNYRPFFSDGDLRSANDMLLAAKGLKGGSGEGSQHLRLFTANDLVNRAAKELGVLPVSGQPDDDEQAAFADFREVVQGKVRAWEDARGKKASEDDLMGILNEIKVNKVYTDTFGFDQQQPIDLLPEEDISRAYVRVGREDIKLSEIPATERANIIAARRRAGLPITEQGIAEYWVRAGKPGKK